MSGRDRPVLAFGARTPVCHEGGSLRDVPARELGLAAATSALAAAGTRAAELGSVIVAGGVPASPSELALGAELRDALGAEAAVAVQVSGSIDAGLGGLAAGIASVELAKRPALVIGVESSSRAPYWSRGLRWRASQGDAELVDPVGAVIAAQGRRGEPRAGDRETQDTFALRSRQRIAASPGNPAAEGPLGTLTPIAGVEGDEPPGRERSQKELAALKPVFDEEGVVTVGSTALPADGAAAVLITPDGDGPALCRSAPSPEAALELVGRGPDEIATAEIYEGTAAEVLSVADSIRMDPEAANPAGGAIGQGSPFAASGILMALRLGSRLQPGDAGLLVGPGFATVMTAL